VTEVVGVFVRFRAPLQELLSEKCMMGSTSNARRAGANFKNFNAAQTLHKA
jgi:hypothetical protein